MHTHKPLNPTAFSPHQLLLFFVNLLPAQALLQLPCLKSKGLYQRLFTPLVTLWYLLFQRLHGDHTLQAVVTDARAGGANALRPGLAGKLRSGATTSYSNARQRLPVIFLRQVLKLMAQRISALSPATTLWKGMPLILLDGSTVRLRPHGDIPKTFRPVRNQNPKATYWCLMRVVAGFCAFTGAAVDCLVASTRLAEQTLACRIILGTSNPSLFIGDSNFGIFTLVQAARAAKQHVLLRLTDRRARRLRGKALRPGDHEVLWSPSAKDKLLPYCRRQPIQGRLLIARIKRKGFRSQSLCLFTNLPKAEDYPLDQLVGLYGLRWHVELNLRYLKTQMEMVQLEAKSANMAKKEWLAGLLAYNLIRAAQLCAALNKGLSPLTLSFTGTRRCLELWLNQVARSRRIAYRLWEKTLEEISCRRLPLRVNPRPPEPRAQRHLRQPYPPLNGSRAKARKALQTLKPKLKS